MGSLRRVDDTGSLGQEPTLQCHARCMYISLHLVQRREVQGSRLGPKTFVELPRVRKQAGLELGGERLW